MRQLVDVVRFPTVLRRRRRRVEEFGNVIAPTTSERFARRRPNERPFVVGPSGAARRRETFAETLLHFGGVERGRFRLLDQTQLELERRRVPRLDPTAPINRDFERFARAEDAVGCAARQERNRTREAVRHKRREIRDLRLRRVERQHRVPFAAVVARGQR